VSARDPIVLPAELTPLVEAIRAVRDAEAAEEAAHEHRRECELRLAELMAVKRRDKDMGFEAGIEAEWAIVGAAIAALPGPAPSGDETREAPAPAPVETREDD
jgi:hypothetical protein